MNTIVLTSKSGLTRASAGITPAVTNILQLFANYVRQCLRIILTFSDVGVSPAIKVLNSLDWLSDRASLVEVNNSAFKIAYADNYKDPKFRLWWKLSMEDQQEVLTTLGSMDPVSTEQSAQAAHDRISFSNACMENKVFQTATETTNLLLNLDAISKAIGASPGERGPLKKLNLSKNSVKPGKCTTPCVESNHPCHEICSWKKDDDKKNAQPWTAEKIMPIVKCARKNISGKTPLKFLIHPCASWKNSTLFPITW